SGVPTGAHTLNLTVQDGAGRTATAVRHVTVTAPSLRVAITQPGADGATVSGTTWFVLWVDGAAAGTKTYTLSVGGTQVASTTDTSSGPISMPWDTTKVNNGSTTVTASVRDASGATGSAPRVVNVSNPYTASFTSPAEGATVGGTITVSVSETGGTGTLNWSVTVDDPRRPPEGIIVICSPSGTASSISCSFDTTMVADGAHTLTATVQDGTGRSGTGARNVTVAAPLSASIPSPTEGATVSGTVPVNMSETGGTGTITWTLRLDGGTTPIFSTSGTASTASFNWDTSGVVAGSHQLQLTVQDGSGRTATAIRNVTVQQGTIRVFITQPGTDGTTVTAGSTVWFTIWLENASGSRTLTLSMDGVAVGNTTTTSNGPISMPWSSSGA